MFTMDRVHTIRELYYNQGVDSLSEIAEKLKCDWRTVKKYVDQEDFSPPEPTPESEVNHESKLDLYKSVIDKWLAEDKNAPRKQRHTAKRIHERLEDEFSDYSCSYRLTASYVSKKKTEMRLKKDEGYLPLIHKPGEGQADFGLTVFYENGHKYEGKHLVLSFPYSNGGYLQLNYGENMECLLEGLQAMFEHAGGVPTEIWFDNTSTIVTKIIKGGGRAITERFSRFEEHYRFKAVFMNPQAGWEKGNVENKVGYLRRNNFVPMPRFENLAKKNIELLSACDTDMQREHYDKGRMICDLFKEDKAALIPLPSVRFDTAAYTAVTTDKYGRFTLDDGKHRYSASPEYCEKTIQCKLTSNEVTVLDQDLHEIVRHKRLYGDEKESMNWIPYMKYVSRRPRSLRNSGIYDMMPENMRHFMDICDNTERGKILKILTELTERTGFDSAVRTVDEAINLQIHDPDSLKNLYRRLFSNVPLLQPLEPSMDVPLGKIIPLHNDLSICDKALKGCVQNG